MRYIYRYGHIYMFDFSIYVKIKKEHYKTITNLKLNEEYIDEEILHSVKHVELDEYDEIPLDLFYQKIPNVTFLDIGRQRNYKNCINNMASLKILRLNINHLENFNNKNISELELVLSHTLINDIITNAVKVLNKLNPDNFINITKLYLVIGGRLYDNYTNILPMLKNIFINVKQLRKNEDTDFDNIRLLNVEESFKIFNKLNNFRKIKSLELNIETIEQFHSFINYKSRLTKLEKLYITICCDINVLDLTDIPKLKCLRIVLIYLNNNVLIYLNTKYLENLYIEDSATAVLCNLDFDFGSPLEVIHLNNIAFFDTKNFHKLSNLKTFYVTNYHHNKIDMSFAEYLFNLESINIVYSEVFITKINTYKLNELILIDTHISPHGIKYLFSLKKDSLINFAVLYKKSVSENILKDFMKRNNINYFKIGKNNYCIYF